MNRLIAPLACLALSTPLAAALQSDLPNANTLLASPAPFQNERFGASLAAEGGFLLVGIPQGISGLAGRVELFQQLVGTAFVPLATASTASPVGDLGASVGIDAAGPTPILIAGSPSDSAPDFKSGSATVYELAGGSLQVLHTLTPPNDAQANSAFGTSVDTDQGVYAVGRPDFASGDVYLWDDNGAGLQFLGKLAASDGGTTGGRFGASVALDGAFLAVGAPGGDAGAVFLYQQFFQGSPFTPITPLSAAKLVGSAAGPGDQFGASVALESDLLVVGAPLEGVGAAYVFRRQGDGLFQEEARLSPPGLPPTASFGATVSVAGGRVVVGAPGDQTNAGTTGTLYVYEEIASETWLADWRLVGSELGSTAALGSAVAQVGGLVVGGAPGTTVSTGQGLVVNAGAALVFAPDEGFCLADSLSPATVSSGDRLGSSLSAAFDVLAVGSPRDEDLASDAGSVSTFVRVGEAWIPAQSIDSPTNLADQRFGASTALGLDGLVVGAPGAPELPFLSGAAHFFPSLGPGLFGSAETLPKPALGGADRFGASVAVGEDRILVGAPGANGGSGRVLSYTRAAPFLPFELTQQYAHPLAGSSDPSVGSMVVARGARAAYGSPGDDESATDAGSVALLHFRPLSLDTFSVLNASAPPLASVVSPSVAFGGAGVARLADLDGNGIVDLAVCLEDDNDLGPAAGSVLLVRLDASGQALSSTKITDAVGFWTGLESGDRLGSAICVGNFDADPQLELAIGARLGDSPGAGNSGDLWIVDLDAAGNVTGTTQITAASLPGPAVLPNASLGDSIASIGDVDGNGIDDLAVGAPFDMDGASVTGSFRIVRLGPGKTILGVERYLPSDLRLPGYAPSNGRLGVSLGFAADGGASGEDLLFIGDSSNTVGGTSFGAIVVAEVQPGGAVVAQSLVSPQLQTFEGFAPSDLFGSTIASPGDLDGNGIADLVTSRPSAEAPGVAADDVGLLLTVLLGPDLSPIDAYTIAPYEPALVPLQAPNLLLGTALDWLGDLDGDGRGELAVQVANGGVFGDAPSVLLCDMVEGWTFAQAPLRPMTPAFGGRFGSAADLDDDDLVVGVPGDSQLAPLGGAVVVFREDAGLAVEQQVLHPSVVEGSLGFGIAVKLDGNTLFVGAPADLAGASGVGRIFRFDRTAPGEDFVETAVFNAEAFALSGDRFGRSIASVGSSLLVGAPGSNLLGTGAGALFDFTFGGTCSSALASADFLTLSDGGTQTIELRPGPQFANLPYLTLASLSSGLLPLGKGVLLPLGIDPLLNLSLSLANTPTFVDTFGTLDAHGEGESLIVLPPGLSPSLSGASLRTAYLVLDLPFLTPVFASEAEVVSFVP